MTVGLLPQLNVEQSMLLDASVRFMDAEFPLAAVRMRAEGDVPLHDRYRATAAKLGWFGLLAGERHGGSSASGNGLRIVDQFDAGETGVIPHGATPDELAPILHAHGGVRPSQMTDLPANLGWAR